jgi:hypothetical protein
MESETDMPLWAMNLFFAATTIPNVNANGNNNPLSPAATRWLGAIMYLVILFALIFFFVNLAKVSRNKEEEVGHDVRGAVLCLVVIAITAAGTGAIGGFTTFLNPLG